MPSHPRQLDRIPALNPQTAIVYFDLVFDDDNFDEDRKSADSGGAERAADFLALGRGDWTKAAMTAEDMAAKEMAAKLKKAGLNGQLSDEGHSDHALVMKFGIDSIDDVRKLVKFIGANMGGGDDVIYLDATYMEARGFQFFPDGVNCVRFRMGGRSGEDLEAWAEGSGPRGTASNRLNRSKNHAR